MKLGLHLNSFTWPVDDRCIASTIVDIAQAAEQAEFEFIAVMDHVWQDAVWMGGAEQPVLECYGTLAYIAAHTSHARLMALASPATYRFPGMLAKTVTTLDVLSGGRAWLGIGVGDYEKEARGLGIPFPSLVERYELLEETIHVCLRMWSGERGDERPLNLKHFRLQRPLNLPQSIVRPHPPILIAGSGEKRTLPLVARFGDACNIRPGPDMPHKLDRLRKLCVAEGRDYEAIERTCPWRFDVGEDGSKVGELIDQLRGLADLGIQTVFGQVVGDHRISPIEIIGREVIPAIADW